MNPGDKIKKRRIELGMSQEELAKKMGYKSRSSINKIENGREVSDKIVSKLAEALDVNPIYLSDWENTVVDEDTDVVNYVLSHPNNFSDGIEDMTDEELALKYLLNTFGEDLNHSSETYFYSYENDEGIGVSEISKEDVDNILNDLINYLKPKMNKYSKELTKQNLKKINNSNNNKIDI